MSNSVEFVGGPLCGQETSATSRWYQLADAKDMAARVLSDGSIGYEFGRHTYERRTYRRGDECIEMYFYAGYRKPT